MQLSEEYFHRHSIKAPLVRHVENASLLFRTPDPTDGAETVKWIMGTILFRPDNSHPGKYQIRLTQPVHNADGRHANNQAVENVTIEWDAYEDHLLSWVNKKINVYPSQVELKVVKEPKQVELTAWEIFVFNYDNALVRYASDGNLFKSLDLDLPFEKRYEGFTEMLGKFQRENAQFYELWNRDLKRNTVDNYAYWLADLIGANSAA